MKIFSAAQVKAWDAFTIANEPVPSLQLMERAALACCRWMAENILPLKVAGVRIILFCGPGNNGGDGLALARLLANNGEQALVYLLKVSESFSGDFTANLHALQQTNVAIHWIEDEAGLPQIQEYDIVVDALFGTGLNRAPHGLAAQLVRHINHSNSIVLAIDMPSGLFADKNTNHDAVVHAQYTLSFESPKLAFFMAENATAMGEVVLLHINLHPAFLAEEQSIYHALDARIIAGKYRPRMRFAHKGNFGHAFIAAGSSGKMGAAILASNAALCAGCGLVTAHTIAEGNDILQIACPEAMTTTGNLPDLEKFTSIAAGPGLGTGPAALAWLTEMIQYFKQYKPANCTLVLDADALNILSENTRLLAQLPPGSVLTPHPKEFERMFGKTQNDFDRLALAVQKATQLNGYIILKGHHSALCTPAGNVYFNTTGNAGMAKGGSGDVLTGLLAGIAAQQYDTESACQLAMYIHGMAGDIAAKKYGPEAMRASQLTENFGEAFISIAQLKQ